MSLLSEMLKTQEEAQDRIKYLKEQLELEEKKIEERKLRIKKYEERQLKTKQGIPLTMEEIKEIEKGEKFIIKVKNTKQRRKLKKKIQEEKLKKEEEESIESAKDDLREKYGEIETNLEELYEIRTALLWLIEHFEWQLETTSQEKYKDDRDFNPIYYLEENDDEEFEDEGTEYIEIMKKLLDILKEKLKQITSFENDFVVNDMIEKIKIIFKENDADKKELEYYIDGFTDHINNLDYHTRITDTDIPIWEDIVKKKDYFIKLSNKPKKRKDIILGFKIAQDIMLEGLFEETEWDKLSENILEIEKYIKENFNELIDFLTKDYPKKIIKKIISSDDTSYIRNY